MKFEFKEKYNINDMLEIMRKLRSEDGCPWDKVQTHSSIRQDFIEEVYEAIEAIDKADVPLLREELGDVLLQIIFHSAIEEEIGNFNFADVVDEVCQKLIVRHPHVFGEVEVANTDEVLANWNRIKSETKGQTTATETLTSVSKSLPALIRAEKVGGRAKRAGMDFADVHDAISSLESEIAELKMAIANGTNISEEVGDLLFSATNVARLCKVEPEIALTESTDKFITRFEKTEELLRLNGISMKSLNINELTAYWQKAKKQNND